jgi:hypothetical protein
MSQGCFITALIVSLFYIVCVLDAVLNQFRKIPLLWRILWQILILEELATSKLHKAGSGASKSGYNAIPQAGYIHTLVAISWKRKMPKYRMHC